MTLEFDPESPCVWTKGLTRIDCPVRHGEGRFVVEDESVLDRMDEAHQLTVRYVDPASPKGEGRTDALLPYPISPNGSARNIAGVCDATGLVFGLMPHPEAIYAKWLHPDHTRYTAPEAEASVPVEERALANGRAKDCRSSATRWSTSELVQVEVVPCPRRPTPPVATTLTPSAALPCC